MAIFGFEDYGANEFGSKTYETLLERVVEGREKPFKEVCGKEIDGTGVVVEMEGLWTIVEWRASEGAVNLEAVTTEVASETLGSLAEASRYSL